MKQPQIIENTRDTVILAIEHGNQINNIICLYHYKTLVAFYSVGLTYVVERISLTTSKRVNDFVHRFGDGSTPFKLSVKDLERKLESILTNEEDEHSFISAHK